uniref:WD repeat-containing protein 44 n=1 Tax=Plectus sambesii TaxID=2011161 RepID=A0A914XFA4_9BILA
MSSDCEDFVDAPEAISEEVVANGGGGGSGGRPRPKALEWSMETTMPQIALFPATPKAVSPANGKPEPVASPNSGLKSPTDRPVRAPRWLPGEHQESSSRPQSSANGSIIEENGNSMTGSATAPAGAPGVVYPVKPPRRKKTSDANESSTLSPLPMERQEMLTPDANIINNSIFNNNINNSPGLLPSSPISPEYFATLETPYREPYKESSSATLPLTQEDWRVLEPVSMRNLDAGENAPSLRHLDRSGSIDPITKDIGRRMSLKQHHSLKRDGSAPSGSSVPSDDTSSTHSFETDAMSTMSSTSRLGHAFTAIRGNVRAMSKVMKGVYVKAKNVTATTPSKLDDLRDGASSNETEEEENDVNESTGIVRPKNAKKGPFDFDQLRQVQDLSGEHTGAVWCVKFSLCGRLLATAGQDNMVRVWVLRNHYEYFNTMRERYNLETKRVGTLNDGLLQKTMDELEQATQLMTDTTPREQREETASTSSERSSSTADDIWAPFAAKPFCTYRGHTADVLDLSWSKNYFILSSGMDRTVRLWHVSRPECLCCFQHMDFVTSIAFLPKDDRYFLSGSLDGKLRLWHIPDKKVALWNEVEQAKLITAMTFVKNGKFAVVGTYNGRCIFFSTDQLKYHTMIDVRSTRGKNSRGHKVTGLAVHGDKLLVTSNDSRVRMYDLRDMALTCKYKGASNERSQIRASFSPDGRHIICGSEDRYVYLWRTVIDAKESLAATLSVRKDRNAMWERIRGHTAVVTAAIFAPKPQLIFAQIENMKRSSAADLFATTPMTGGAKSATTPKGKTIAGDVIVSADLSGTVKVFINRTRIKTGSSVFFPTD